MNTIFYGMNASIPVVENDNSALYQNDNSGVVKMTTPNKENHIKENH